MKVGKDLQDQVHQPTSTLPAKPGPQGPCLHGFWTPPAMRTPPPPWAARSNASSLSVKKFFIISNPNLPRCNPRPLPLALNTRGPRFFGSTFLRSNPTRNGRTCSTRARSSALEANKREVNTPLPLCLPRANAS